jgi:hypothetical protein
MACNYRHKKKCQIPNLPPKSVLVMDNAIARKQTTFPLPIQKRPSSRHGCSKMTLCLTRKLTSQSYGNLFKPIKSPIKSIKLMILLQYMTQSLPPYHCELNPIEMIWSQIKQRIQVRKIVGVQSRNKCSLGNVERKEWAGLFL